MAAQRAKRINCYQALNKSGLLKNLTDVAAGYRKAGMPGLSALVTAIRRDAKPGMTFSDMMEFQDVAHTLCAVAIFALADLGYPAWIKRREAHLKKMEVSKGSRTQTPREAAAWVKTVADIRAAMKFPDGPPAKAKRVAKKK